MIRVLIAEDSPTCRELLVEIIDSEADLRVVGAARNGDEAVTLVKQLKPDVVVMDLYMPELDGYEATRRIMVEAPTPIVIVSSSADIREARTSMHALRVGALTVLQKPQPGSDFDESIRQFNATVRAMAGVRVVRRWSEKPVARTALPIAQPTAPVRIIAIAASTGGPAALHRVFSDLSAEVSTPILVVQHIAPGFVDGLATWLAETSRLAVKIGTHGELLAPRTVYLAPDDQHMGLSARGTIEISRTPPIGGFRPSASVLFRSVAKAYGRTALAIILTGMGEDGVEGLHAVHAAGGRIIAQDEASSVVFGMPGAAVAAGLPDAVLPLHLVAPRLSIIIAAANAVEGRAS